jgi:hypothetical protein
MSFTGDIQLHFPSRGAAFDLSPAFQRRERRHLDLPVAERRLTGKFGERPLRMTKAPALFVPENLRSTVAAATMENYHVYPGVETPMRLS